MRSETKTEKSSTRPDTATEADTFESEIPAAQQDTFSPMDTAAQESLEQALAGDRRDQDARALDWRSIAGRPIKRALRSLMISQHSAARAALLAADRTTYYRYVVQQVKCTFLITNLSFFFEDFEDTMISFVRILCW